MWSSPSHCDPPVVCADRAGQLPASAVFPERVAMYTGLAKLNSNHGGCQVICEKSKLAFGQRALQLTCTILLIAGATIIAQANCASAQSTSPSPETTPSIAAAGNARIVSQLTPDERARFGAECKSEYSSEQNECIVTRAFVVQCHAVVDGRLDPTMLWAFPGPFILKYLSPAEKPIVLQALRESTTALESLNSKSQ